MSAYLNIYQNNESHEGIWPSSFRGDVDRRTDDGQKTIRKTHPLCSGELKIGEKKSLVITYFGIHDLQCFDVFYIVAFPHTDFIRSWHYW